MATDLFGRETGNADVKSMVSSLSGEVTKILETKDVGAEATMSKVLDAVEQLATRIDSGANKEAGEISDFADSVISSYKDIYKRQNKDDQKLSKSETMESRLGRKATERIVKMGASPHTFWTGVGHFDNQAISQLKKVFSSSLIDCGLCGTGARLDKMAQSASNSQNKQNATQSMGSTSSDSGGVMNSPQGGGSSHFMMTANKLQLVAYGLSALAAHLSNVFEVHIGDAFKGLLIDSNRFQERMRQIVFQTQGFGETNRQLEKEFMNTSEAVRQAGVSRSNYEKIFADNVQRGYGFMSKMEKSGKTQTQILEKQVKTQRSVTTTALNTATALGMSVDGMNDMFMNWHLQLGMSANELSNMGRSMRQISLSTGITGANLERAMKSSEDILKNMRNTGSLTDVSAKNVISMMAEAQKTGIDDTMGPILKAMGGGNAMFNADEKTKKLLNALMTGNGSAGNPGGMYWAIRSGDILKDKKAMNQGADNLKARTTKALSAAGVKDAENVDITQLSKVMKDMDSKQKAILQSNLENMVGAGAGEIERLAQLFQNQGKTEGQKSKELSDQIKKAEGPGGRATDASKALVRKKEEMDTSNIATVLNSVSDSMSKEGKTFSEAMSTARKTYGGDFGEDYLEEILKNPTKATGDLMNSLGSRAKNAGRDIDELTMQKGGISSTQLKKDLASGDKNKMEKATATLNDVMQEIAQAERTSQDPATSMAEGIRLANNTLHDVVRAALFSNDTLKSILIILGTIGATTASILAILIYMKGIQSILGMGGGGAAGGLLNTVKGLLNTVKGWFGIGGAVGAAKSAMDLTKLAPFAHGGDGIASKIPTSFEAWNAAFPKAATAATAGTEAAATTSFMSRFASTLSKFAGPLTMALGAVTGAIEAKSVGRTTGEGAVAGALTGGAGTGSFLSSSIGVQKGGAIDKTLGVAGAVAWGAAIGSVIPGVGTLIGAIVGGATELVKIITEGTTILADIVAPIQGLLDFVYNVFKNIGGVFYNLFTLNITKAVGSFFSIFTEGIWDLGKSIVSIFTGTLWGIVKLVGRIIKVIWNGLLSLATNFLSILKSVFIDFPAWLSKQIWSGLTWVGGLGAWLGKNIMSGLKSAFTSVSSVGGSVVSGIMSGLKSVFVDFIPWLGSSLLSGLKSVFVDFPPWLYNQVVAGLSAAFNFGAWMKKGLEGLTDNEWVGPIFQTLSKAFNEIYDAWMEVYKPLKETFDDISKIFMDTINDISTALAPIGKAVSDVFSSIGKVFGIEWNLGDWNLLGTAMSALQITVHVLAQAISWLLSPLVLLAKILGFLLKIIGSVVKVVGTLITGFAQVLKGLFTFNSNDIIDGLAVMLQKVPQMIGDMFMKGVSNAWTGVTSFFGKIKDYFMGGWKSIFSDFPAWISDKLYNMMTSVFVDFPKWVGDKMYGMVATVFGPDFSAWMFENITKGLEGLGDWIYDHTIGAIMNRIPDWVKNLVGGAAGAVMDPIGTAKGALSKVGGAIMDPIGTSKSMLNTAGAAASQVGKWGYDAGSAVLDWINPFNYFQEGTKSVQQPGLAVLHQGEMVVPKEEVKAITAIGNGPFGSASSLNAGAFENGQAKEAVDGGMSQKTLEIMASMATNQINMIGDTFGASKEGSGLTQQLIDALYCVCSSVQGIVSGGIGLGLFDPVNISNAMSDSVTTMISTMISPISAISSMFDSLKKPFGLNGGESIFTKLSSAFTSKSNTEKSNNTVADSGKAMYYSDMMSAINQTPLGGMVDALMQTPIGQAASAIFGVGKGEASSNILDYSESTKGSVSPAMLNLADVENRVAQEKYGSLPSSGGIIPGMGNIEDYLAKENHMSNRMIEILERIENNTNHKPRSNVVGTQSNGRPPLGGMKMRKISQEQNSGEWDITHGDFAPSSITKT